MKLDDLPLATLTHLVGIALAALLYISGDISGFHALIGAGIVSFGAGKVGEARNGAGRGLRK